MIAPASAIVSGIVSARRSAAVSVSNGDSSATGNTVGDSGSGAVSAFFAVLRDRLRGGALAADSSPDGVSVTGVFRERRRAGFTGSAASGSAASTLSEGGAGASSTTGRILATAAAAMAAAASSSEAGTNASTLDDVITSSSGCALLAFLVVPADVPAFLLRDLLAIGTPTAALGCSLGASVEGTHDRRASADDETATFDPSAGMRSYRHRYGSSQRRSCTLDVVELFLRHH